MSGLTYTSNAIEGNTLSLAETALVVEKGITIGGKTITEHLEAINHAQAITFIKQLVTKKRTELKHQRTIIPILQSLYDQLFLGGDKFSHPTFFLRVDQK
jgi:Fic family protein